MAQSNQPYSTQNADLASFLILEGIKFLGCRRDAINPHVVVMEFQDDRGQCLDLERVFVGSPYKQYRDINKWLLGKIHAALRDSGQSVV